MVKLKKHRRRRHIVRGSSVTKNAISINDRICGGVIHRPGNLIKCTIGDVTANKQTKNTSADKSEELIYAFVVVTGVLFESGDSYVGRPRRNSPKYMFARNHVRSTMLVFLRTLYTYKSHLCENVLKRYVFEFTSVQNVKAKNTKFVIRSLT